VEHFATAAATRLGRQPCELSADGLDLLCNYHWPGNVRELENLITRASVLSDGRGIRADDLRLWLIDPTGQCHAYETADSFAQAGEPISVGTRLEDMERRLIEATLEHYGGHRAKAAQALGIGIRTLTNKLRLYGYAPRARTFGKAA
jgi:DNA-binding NtrC family response regulator